MSMDETEMHQEAEAPDEREGSSTQLIWVELNVPAEEIYDNSVSEEPAGFYVLSEDFDSAAIKVRKVLDAKGFEDVRVTGMSVVAQNLFQPEVGCTLLSVN